MSVRRVERDEAYEDNGWIDNMKRYSGDPAGDLVLYSMYDYSESQSVKVENEEYIIRNRVGELYTSGQLIIYAIEKI